MLDFGGERYTNNSRELLTYPAGKKVCITRPTTHFFTAENCRKVHSIRKFVLLVLNNQSS